MKSGIPYIFKVPVQVLAKPFEEMEGFAHGAQPMLEIVGFFDSASLRLKDGFEAEYIPPEIQPKYAEIQAIFDRMDRFHKDDFWEYGAHEKYQEWSTIQSIARDICTAMGWDYRENVEM